MSLQNAFLAPRLVGERFKNHAIPFDMLKDLAVLEALLIEAAKWKYLQANPDRKRVPRGFAEAVSLELQAIHTGSSIPVIGLKKTETGILSPELDPHYSYFIQAREAIFEAVQAASQQGVSQALPAHLLSYFDTLGRSLREDECLEFNSQQPQTPARLTPQTRQRLLEASRMKEWTKDITLRGYVPEADQDKMSFDLLLLSTGQRIRAPLDFQHQETILEAFNGYRDQKKILLRGIGRYNRASKLQSLDSVEHVTLLDEQDPGARLDEFRNLKTGWLHGKGRSLSTQGLDWLTHQFDVHYPETAPTPYLYPTAEGGVQAEWSLGVYELSLEIDLVTHQAQWHLLNLNTENDQLEVLDLNKTSGWQYLVSSLIQLASETVPS